MPSSPLSEGRRARGRGVNVEPSLHQPAYLLPSDNDVALHRAKDPTYPVPDARRDGHHWAGTTNNFANRLDQFSIGEGLGTDRLNNHVVSPCAFLNRKRRQIIHIDGLQTILPI